MELRTTKLHLLTCELVQSSVIYLCLCVLQRTCIGCDSVSVGIQHCVLINSSGATTFCLSFIQLFQSSRTSWFALLCINTHKPSRATCYTDHSTGQQLLDITRLGHCIVITLQGWVEYIYVMLFFCVCWLAFLVRLLNGVSVICEKSLHMQQYSLTCTVGCQCQNKYQQKIWM